MGLIGGSLGLSSFLPEEDYLIRFRKNDKIDWKKVKDYFPIAKNKTLHLNSGSAGVIPTPVKKKLFECIDMMNEMPPYEAWEKWETVRTNNKENIAQHLNVSPQEIAIVRNATEALNNIIFGYPLQKRDELLAAEHDYPHALSALQQRAKRDQLTLNTIQIDLLNSTDEEIVQQYVNAVTDHTRLVLLTHITHREGQILPISKITKALKEKNIKVLLDAAHSYGQINHDIPTLGVDFYATSLHKWQNAPHGTGVLYIRSNQIKRVYSLQSSTPELEDRIDKFEYLGTRAFHQEVGVGAAILFNELIGIEKKQARLNDLKNYWMDAIRSIDGVQFGTDPKRSCAIASFGFSNISSSKAIKLFHKKHDIHLKTVAINRKGYIRVSPNIFTLEKDLDRFIKAVHTISKL